MSTINAIGSDKPIQVSFGGTGAATLTSHGVLLGNTTSTIGATAEGATGSCLMGTTGANPSFTGSPSFSGSVTAGTTITATLGDLTLTDGDAIITNKDVATTSPLVYFKKYRAAAALTSGDLTGTVKFGGYDGTQVTDSARITSTSSGTIASTRVAGNLQFYTHPDSAAADPTLRMTIASTGAVTIAVPDAGNITIGGVYGITPGGTINVALVDSNGVFGSVANLSVAQGGTGVGTLTDHGILLGSGTGAITPLGVASDGQLPIGSSGADPVLATLTAGTNVTITNGAGTITIAATTVGINDQTDSYQLVAGDAGKLITMTKASANTLTVPKDATVNFAIGTQILVYQGGAGTTTIAPEDGTITIRSAGSALNLYTQYSEAILIKIANNLWVLSGDIA